jgi:hypothetical protein
VVRDLEVEIRRLRRPTQTELWWSLLQTL